MGPSLDTNPFRNNSNEELSSQFGILANSSYPLMLKSGKFQEIGYIRLFLEKVLSFVTLGLREDPTSSTKLQQGAISLLKVAGDKGVFNSENVGKIHLVEKHFKTPPAE